MTSTLAEAAYAHHGLPAHEVVLLLQSDPVAGLTSAEAEQRLRRFGPNVLPRGRPDGPVTVVDLCGSELAHDGSLRPVAWAVVALDKRVQHRTDW